MKNIPGENVTKMKKTVVTKSGKVEFDKNIDTKDLKATVAHGSHRVHGSD